MARDERVPASAKGMLVVAGAYLVSPIDLIPGIIPVAGQIDDLYVVLTGLQQAIRFCPPGVAEGHFAAAGLTSDSVDRDLATIRQFVRRGLAWSMEQGGRLVARSSRQVASLVRRLGQRGDIHHDQTPGKQESAAERS
jgi:uncharacterized membrane protein YkvA (DUF1232 family)